MVPLEVGQRHRLDNNWRLVNLPSCRKLKGAVKIADDEAMNTPSTAPIRFSPVTFGRRRATVGVMVARRSVTSTSASACCYTAPLAGFQKNRTAEGNMNDSFSVGYNDGPR